MDMLFVRKPVPGFEESITSNIDTANTSDTNSAESNDKQEVVISEKESIDIPNAQSMKYSTPKQPSHSEATHTPSQVPTPVQNPLDDDNVPPSTFHCNPSSSQPPTTTAKQSTNGPYSLISNTIRLSNL